MTEPAEEPFRVAIVAGVTPDKWVRRWRERFPAQPIEVLVVDDADQVAVLLEGRARMSFVRMPVDREGLHLIPLWSEVQVAVLSRDHPLAEFDELERGDLADELVLESLPPRTAVETVAAGSGVAFLPMSVARAHHRKDVRAVPVTDLAETRVGLAWPVGEDDPRVEEFIGIVRGRTERSSRGATKQEPAKARKPEPGKARKPEPGKAKKKTAGPRKRRR